MISATGVVGRVKFCSEHFSTITSLLNTDNMMVSSKLKHSNVYGSAKWKGTNPGIINFLWVSRHQSVNPGDTVITSEYNGTFMSGIMIGVVKEARLKPNDDYYDIDVALSTNFGNLAYVYVIENKLLKEQQTLEHNSSTK